MNFDLLKSKLLPRTTLILGDVKDTVPNFVRKAQNIPVGFISIDVDFYTSTCDVLQILSMPERKMLIRVVVYLDDTETINYHKFAGELLAVEEFNATNEHVKIDRWRGLRSDLVFPESRWIGRMYVAYDLEAIPRYARTPESKHVLDLSDPTGNRENIVVGNSDKRGAAAVS